MKIIKYNFSNWYKGFNPVDFHNFFVDLFKEDHDISLQLSDKPDYIIYGVYGDYISSACRDNFDVVKILYITEPTYPDYQFFDYCIGFEPQVSYGKRYCFFNPYINCILDNYPKISNKKAEEIINQKSIFCELICSHDGHDISRKHFYNLLSSYKRVDSAGTFMNNQKGNINVTYHNSSKHDFQKHCKFSLCLQSTNIDWFINEKIFHSINAYTIPIFYGPESVKNIINPRRFLFIEDYQTEEELLDKIIEIDNDDQLFLKIISEPPLKNPDFKHLAKKHLYSFLKNIFISDNPKVLRNEFTVQRNISLINNRNNKIRKINKYFGFLNYFKK